MRVRVWHNPTKRKTRIKGVWVKNALIGVGGFLLALFLLTSISFRILTWWLDFSDEVGPSDIIVVLGGSYTRAPFAAELFEKGFGTDIWVSRTQPSAADRVLEGIGVPNLPEDRFNTLILERKGVPTARIRPYGNGVVSTQDEADALRREFGATGRILIVTSRFHARRAKKIFKKALPAAEIRVVATPYDPFHDPWWQHKELAQNGVLEGIKVLYYYSGGRLRQ